VLKIKQAANHVKYLQKMILMYKEKEVMSVVQRRQTFDLLIERRRIKGEMKKRGGGGELSFVYSMRLRS